MGLGKRCFCRTNACLLAMLLALSGCGENTSLPGPEPQPVKGKVTYRGEPAAGFLVVFNPLEKWEGPVFAPSAVTNADGEFQLHSYADNDGAPVGEYAVTFQWPKEVVTDDPDDAPERIDRLHGAFSNPQESQFKVTVSEGENSLEPFALR